MRSDPEASAPRDARSPFADVAVRDLLDPSAGFAHQVMVMLDRAEPVTQLDGILTEHVDDAIGGEQAERAVDGGKAGTAPRVTQPVVQLLRRQRLSAVQGGEHFAALFRLAPHAATFPRASDRRASLYASESR